VSTALQQGLCEAFDKAMTAVAAVGLRLRCTSKQMQPHGNWRTTVGFVLGLDSCTVHVRYASTSLLHSWCQWQPRHGFWCVTAVSKFLYVLMLAGV
jgi:hypothetical protein